ncbi:hypothetical protein TIFTF001_051924 [Ficus carica]|uniref:Uncharacterized protein n=1 Tax=Ficus carica TaxID=3494 RepID=A0AA88EFC8_FICCA|nr:hypothetical protein TIFTF001_051924 [Ficus carica]
MESSESSLPQPLPKGEVKEAVNMQADEATLDFAEDTCDYKAEIDIEEERHWGATMSNKSLFGQNDYGTRIVSDLSCL